MISSIEFIKGYTKIIICSYLFQSPDYLYNIVKKIIKDGEGYIQISNPSALMVMKELEREEFVLSYIEISEQNQARKYYKLTDKGKEFYLSNYSEYVKSLEILNKIIGGNDEY